MDGHVNLVPPRQAPSLFKKPSSHTQTSSHIAFGSKHRFNRVHSYVSSETFHQITMLGKKYNAFKL